MVVGPLHALSLCLVLQVSILLHDWHLFIIQVSAQMSFLRDTYPEPQSKALPLFSLSQLYHLVLLFSLHLGVSELIFTYCLFVLSCSAHCSILSLEQSLACGSFSYKYVFNREIIEFESLYHPDIILSYKNCFKNNSCLY